MIVFSIAPQVHFENSSLNGTFSWMCGLSDCIWTLDQIGTNSVTGLWPVFLLGRKGGILVSLKITDKPALEPIRSER